MSTLTQRDEDALHVAAEAILLDLPHRWPPTSGKTLARYRKRDEHGRPTVEARAWLVKAANAILRDLKYDTLTTFPTDPVDHACLVAALFLLSLRGGLPADNLAAHKLASTLRELEANARRHLHTVKAASGGEALATAKRSDTADADPVNVAIDEALHAMPGVGTATLMKTLRPKLKAMGEDALRKRIERRRKALAKLP